MIFKRKRDKKEDTQVELTGYVTMAQDKPKDKALEDWTLGEVRKKCMLRGACRMGCPFFRSAGCSLMPDGHSPGVYWDLTEKARFTEGERKAAQAILTLWPGATQVGGTVKTLGGVTIPGYIGVTVGGEMPAYIDSERFPSIKSGELVSIKDIIGE